jgi:arylsulfatase A-like enzyme/Tfp pilus assembly protein PilF
VRGRLVPELALLAVLAGCGGPVAPPPAENRPVNVLLITVDTLRADALGAYGNPRAATPWMDRLAAGGVRFDAAHAHNVVTLPSHANILSGLYPSDHGVRDNAGFRFPAAIPTLATVLKARGYATAAFVSAFPLASRFGLARGFDVYDDSFVDAAPRTPLLEQERSGPETVALARRWLDAHAAGPAFVWVHLFEPHAPYAPPEPFASRFSADPYAGDVAAADAALEPLLRPIVERGGTGPATLVVLTADHGESLGEHGEATHGVFAYESTLRVPLILYEPARLAPRAVAESVRHVDIAPTIFDAIGAPLDSTMRGRSLLPIASGQKESEPPLTYFESLSPALNRGWAPLRGVARGTVKFIDLPIPELYDLAADAGETRNLMATRGADAADLRQRLADFSSRGAATPALEDADARARLRALGYASATQPLHPRYTERDDPKRLMSLDARLQESVRLYTAGDRAQALAIVRALVRDRPDMRVAWMTLAQIERDGQDLDAAIASMRRAHALAPGDPQTLSLLGAYLTERGRSAEAIALLSPALAGDPPDLQVLVTLGLAQAQAGQAADGVATLERARAAYPSNARLLVELGTVQLIAGRRAAARDSFALAVARNPGLARAHSSLAAIDAEDGRASQAVAEWREATRLDGSEYRRIFLLGLSLARAGKPGPARTCLAFFAEQAPAGMYAREIAAAREWLAGGGPRNLR